MEKKYLKFNKSHFKYFPLKPEIKDLLASKNFKNPTLVQGQALSILLQQGLIDVCVIIYSFNGSGKTLSFLIPVLNSVNHLIPCSTYKTQSMGNKTTDVCIAQPQAIIIVPTETLLQQTYNYLTEYAQYLQDQYNWKIKIGRIFKTANEHGHILVGLANKTNAYFGQSNSFLSQLKWVVFDECDDVKTSEPDNFKKLISNLSKTSNANFILCSATGNNEGDVDDPEEMTKTGFRREIQENVPNRNVVELDILKVLSNVSLTGVFHFTMPAQHKDQFIVQLLYKYSSKAVKNQIIIFFNTKIQVRNFYQFLKSQSRFHVNSPVSVQNNIRLGYVHGDCGCKPIPHQHTEDCQFTKSQRTNKLRNKDYDVMLATDIIGRGIDIRTVTLVLNYSQPLKKNKYISETNYIHRVGRTGRYTDTGVGLTFVNGKDLQNAVKNRHKVEFHEVKNIDQILKQSQDCFEANSKEEEK